MKTNMGQFDRYLRLAIASIIIAFLITGKFTGGMSFLMGIVAVVMIATSVVLTCPLYKILGIKTTFHRS